MDKLHHPSAKSRRKPRSRQARRSRPPVEARGPEQLSIEVLQTFWAVIDHGGDAGAAARQLGISQPNMSKRLKQLRAGSKHLAKPWLDRTGKKWTLTTEGNAVFSAVAEILTRYAELSRFAHTQVPVAPVLRFACGQTGVMGVVKDAYKAFHDERRNVELRISTMPSRERIIGVANGAIDLALVTEEENVIAEIARRPLHVEEFERAEIVAICASDATWAKALRAAKRRGEPVSLDMLAMFPLILPETSSDVRRRLDEVIQRGLTRASDLNVVLEVGGWPHVIEYALLKAGVGIVSRAAIPLQSDLIWHPLDPKVCPPSITSLICRLSPTGSGAKDLSTEGQDWFNALKAAVPRTR